MNLKAIGYGIGYGVSIACMIIIAVIMVFSAMQPPLSPTIAFQRESALVEYCYLNITSIGLTPIKYDDTRIYMKKVYNYHEECVDRSLNITSIGDMKQMEIEKFWSYFGNYKTNFYIKNSMNRLGNDWSAEF